MKIDPIQEILNASKKEPETESLDLSDYVIDWEKDYGAIIPVWKVRDETVCTLGDVGLVTGASKSGKSHVLQAIIKASLKKESDNIDTFSMWAMPAKGRKIFYVDTEQHPSKTKFSGLHIAKDLGIKKPPANLKYINIRELEKKKRFPRLVNTIEKYKRDEVLFWIIDGLADLISDVNESVESNDIIEKLMALASQKNCSFIVNLHENPTGGKLRGHLGSESTRKCSGYVSVKKNKEKSLHTIEAGVSRDGGDFEPVGFRWIVGEGFRSVDGAELERIKLSTKEQNELEKKLKLTATLQKVFGKEKQLSKSLVKSGFTTHWNGGCVSKTAERQISLCIEFELIEEKENIIHLKIENQK